MLDRLRNKKSTTRAKLYTTPTQKRRTKSIIQRPHHKTRVTNRHPSGSSRRVQSTLTTPGQSIPITPQPPSQSSPPYRPIIAIGIETSCDDTSISVVSSDCRVLSTASLTQLGIHQLHGGVVPTIAMRSHAITINHLLAKALLGAAMVSTTHSSAPSLPVNLDITPQLLPTPPHGAKYLKNSYLANTYDNQTWFEAELDKMDQFRQHLFLRSRVDSPTPTTQVDQSLQLDCDSIAFTLGPGLSGSLAVGVDTAKALGRAFRIPIIPVNHIIAHTTVAQLTDPEVSYPYLGLVVSGGHTQLNYVKDEQTVTVLASTQDDAIGEAFDKIYRNIEMESLNMPQIQDIINREQAKVRDRLRDVRFCWPANIHELVTASSNELLIDSYNSILHSSTIADPTGLSHHGDQSLDRLSQRIEDDEIAFIQNIQTVPSLQIKPIRLAAIGAVNDLYNTKRTPPELFPTLTEALSRWEEVENDQHNHSISSGSEQTSSSPLPTSDSSQSPTPLHQITPKSERQVLTALSNQKIIPPGAQIENAARMHSDIFNILSAYDFMITQCTQTQTPLMARVDHIRAKWFNIESNRAFGIIRKVGKLLPQHRFLPIVPLPLPFYTTSPGQSYTALSYSGLKAKIRQHVQAEVGFMNSIEALLENVWSPLTNSERSSSCLPTPLSPLDDDTNPFSRAPLRSLNDIPIYLHHLLANNITGHQLSTRSKSVSNLYRLCVSAQFQMTATEHLIQQMTRSIKYLDHSIPGQSGIHLMIQPQPLSQVTMSPNDPSFYMGHPENPVIPPLPSSITTLSNSPPYINNISHDITNNPTRTTSLLWATFSQSVLQHGIDKFNHVVIGGGVACNKYITGNIKAYFDGFENVLRASSQAQSQLVQTPHDPSSTDSVPPTLSPFRVVVVPPINCADNGSMIAWAGLQKFTQAHPEPSLSHLPYPHLESSSHIVDPESLQYQQEVMDRHFVQRFGTLNGLSDSSTHPSPTSRAEEYSILYQRPKWPLHEVFVPKPTRLKNR